MKFVGRFALKRIYLPRLKTAGIRTHCATSRIAASIASIVTPLPPTCTWAPRHFPRTFARGRTSGTFCELFSTTAYNYTPGRLEFHDRRTRPPIKEPMARSKISPSLSPGHVRDFSSRVIFHGCAARVGMSAGTQTLTKGYVYLRLARGIFFPSSSSAIFAYSLSRSRARFLPFSFLWQ